MHDCVDVGRPLSGADIPQVRRLVSIALDGLRAEWVTNSTKTLMSGTIRAKLLAYNIIFTSIRLLCVGQIKLC
ncbi:hypothetical protein BDV37DRAFT_284060 [Aspergillus pseudonomiae]|uniref:Uncharacterized protein n=1 Tax=Aspergillus pseudonomiae TaxID=1506151 RepID=A0A5N7D9D7_9EURO|nr:uncharacterized protein BDV37DRAFT_284060 [Aspergillus pseudonomiae]KAE8403072.1 hypothetical protein BDV37DRAFT_284060 [Aspergillus pseudonomiae]